MEKSVQQNKKFNAIRGLFIAPSNYGKSFQMVQYVLNKIKEGQFDPDRIVIMSPTARSDSTLKPLIQYCQSKNPQFIKQHMYENVNEDLLKDIYETQKQIKEKVNNPLIKQDKAHLLKHYLIIIDDSIADSAFQSAKKGSILTKLATSGRHFNISTITIVQSYRSIGSRTNLKQLSVIYIGKINSQYEIEDILKDVCAIPNMSAKQGFLQVMDFFHDAVTKHDNRGFLIIHPYVQYGYGRFQHSADSNWFYDIQGVGYTFEPQKGQKKTYKLSQKDELSDLSD